MRWNDQEPPKVTKAKPGDGAAALVQARDGLTWGEEVEAAVDLVVLAVGMQPADVSALVESLKLPVGADRFLQEVHPKLRPVELAVNGVLVAGTSQGPKDITESSRRRPPRLPKRPRCSRPGTSSSTPSWRTSMRRSARAPAPVSPSARTRAPSSCTTTPTVANARS